MKEKRGDRKDVGAEDRRPQFDDPGTKARQKKVQIVKREDAERVVPFLSHLPQYAPHSDSVVGQHTGVMPTAVVKVGAKYAHGSIRGSSARTAAFGEALSEVIQSFSLSATSSASTRPNDASLDESSAASRDFRRELDKEIKRCVQFVIDCRQMSIFMGNFVRHVRAHISTLPADISEHEARLNLLKFMQEYMNSKLFMAFKTVALVASERAVTDGDVIMTVGRSAIVERALVDAARYGKRFRVMILESRPHTDGLISARILNSAGIRVEYGLISAASYLLPEASKVLIGAHGIFSNGAVLSRVGTAAVAALANMQRTPVIVACESSKFSERVQLDALCFNELGDADALLVNSRERTKSSVQSDPAGNSHSGKKKGASEHSKHSNSMDALGPDWRSESEGLNLLNLLYDLTPIDLIDAVITDVGVIPASSVPIVLSGHT
uniref:Translation initiation factor eIF2B subunit delta n=1 Tax=Timspurckia oligopyrenoides TaxID=708627 RepID=A0A7S1ET09_9RHOD|mmetsp:Transcript_512/g.916  ORF Transcript_512/g.916 Transcript_512/m.916 type:complete len:439 (+) Transcript_512:45-1361(+)